MCFDFTNHKTFHSMIQGTKFEKEVFYNYPVGWTNTKYLIIQIRSWKNFFSSSVLLVNNLTILFIFAENT